MVVAVHQVVETEVVSEVAENVKSDLVTGIANLVISIIMQVAILATSATILNNN